MVLTMPPCPFAPPASVFAPPESIDGTMRALRFFRRFAKRNGVFSLFTVAVLSGK
jgi:hypothetical protein